MSNENEERNRAALEVLRSTGLDVLDAALVAREAMTAGNGSVSRMRKCLELGTEQLKLRERTVSFAKAVEEAVDARIRKGLRPRSIVDFRYVCRRLIMRNPWLAGRRIRCMTPGDCERCLTTAFGSRPQFKKARAILSGVFSSAIRKGWCDSNPVSRVEVPVIREQRAHVLEPQEIETLLRTAEHFEGGICLPAVGLMLYAGIRPHEVVRLNWEHIDLEQGFISILPRHSKTGGARRVSILKPLKSILRQSMTRLPQGRICPRNWRMRWQALRRQAGWDGEHSKWPQDSLRHTFASYHLSYFRDYTALQWEMGHRSSALLRTRYVDTTSVRDARAFWGDSIPEKTKQ